MVNFIVGYIISINMISYLFVWINVRTKIIQLDKKWEDTLYLCLAILGGFVGIMIAAEMFNYRRNEKIFKRYIPLVIFIEVCIILYFIYKLRA